MKKIIENTTQAKESYALKLKILKRLYENNCKLLIGGDASIHFQAYGFNIYEEMLHWQQAGIDNFSILKAATITPAQYLKEDHLWGSIVAGKQAELIILEENPLADINNIGTINFTIIGLNIIRNQALLNQFR